LEVFLYALFLSTLVSLQLNVSDDTGHIVAGAAVYVDDYLIAVTDAAGVARIPDGTDFVTIRVLGYALYSDSIRDKDSIVLRTVPVPSGMVISVIGERSILRGCIPSTTVLSGDDMQEISSCGIRTISRKSSGILIREYGGAMPIISFSIRGSSSEQINYLVDGHSLESTMDGLPGLNLDPSVFSGLLISRGAGSGFAGGGGAGTVEFLSESVHTPARMSIRADNTGGAGISGAVTLGSLRTALSLRRLEGVSGSVGYDGTFLISGDGEDFDFGFLGNTSEGETESPDMFYPTDGIRRRISLDSWCSWKIGRLVLSGGNRIGRLEYTESTPLQFDDTHDECRLDFSGEYSFDTSRTDFEIAAETGFEIVSSTSLGERYRGFWDFSAKCGYSEVISIITGIRVKAAGQNHQIGGRLTASFPVLDSACIMHASISRGFRFPTMNELHWQEDVFAAGNPELETEVTGEGEIGIAFPSWDILKFSAAAFIAHTDEMIIWLPGDDGKWRPENIGKASRKGIEVDGWFSAEVFTLSGNLTLLSAVDDTPGETTEGCELPYMADVIWAVTAECKLPYEWTLTASVNETGRRFTNRSETKWLSAYRLFGAGIDMPLNSVLGNLSAGIFVDNILDTEYEESNGYSGKPRTIGLAFYWNDGGGE